MQPSEYEIQREVEALRDIRRRSTAGGPGSLILDPDLPGASSQASSTTAYWSPADDSSSSSHEDGSDTSSADAKDDPFHLFWVPARLHPEIAPAEFRQFLKEHARAPVDEVGVLARSTSTGSELGRKRSMLSRQYKPSANDGVGEEEESVVPLRQNRTSVFANSGPQLTINDLQKLEELAEEASKSDDPTKLRSVLRRSLSYNVAPSVIDQMDDIPELGDDADSPIIVPRPGQVLRRAARTKIRKPGMTGEGSHRFTATRSRRKSINRAATMQEPRTSSDMSSSDHGDAEPSRRSRANSEVSEIPPLPRPESYSEEALIYDAYASEEPEDTEGLATATTPEPSLESASLSSPPSTFSHTETSEPVLEDDVTPTISPVLHHPQPQRAAVPVIPVPAVSPRSPSPESVPSAPPSTSSQPRPSLQEAPPYHSPSPSISDQRREKDKKGGLFGKWGSDKSSKKNHKDKDHRDREKDKDSSWLGSLFGSKKKQEESSAPLGIGTSGRETAAALLGASKSSRNYVPSPSPQLAGAYARYPIHVERAIYRLSHIKLANPRRPLYEQVLISNLMFWYLGVINKAQTPTPASGTGQPQTMPTPAEKEQQEREQREREEQERTEKERLEREQEQKDRQRRGSLTKTPTAGSLAPGSRRAEMPVRGPQYEMQHRVMEQEYGYTPLGNGSGGSSLARTSSVPATASGYQAQPISRPPTAPPSQYGVQLVQPQPQSMSNGFYNMGNIPVQTQQYSPLVVGGSLPPGAMPPVAVEQTWLANSSLATSRNSPPPRSSSPPSSSPSPSTSPRRTRSPPPANRYTPAQEKQPYSGGRLPGRSLSASAAPPVPTMHQVNGKIKKGSSAHAVVQNHRRSNEDEDMPLSIWQQQQRRKYPCNLYCFGPIL
ncbi:hypothetical protein AcW2_005751 [Taiwanofungus camphoratus]|nr:hypothetical protein AcW2_005751 [Antrodia cinnamomea]